MFTLLSRSWKGYGKKLRFLSVSGLPKRRISSSRKPDINSSMLRWQKIPDTTGQNVNFIDRIDGFKKAVTVLNYAIDVYNANPPGSSVLNRLPSEVNIINTLYALKARYSLFAGDNAGALAAANLVDITKKSTFNYTAQALNPVFESATSTNNVFQPVDSTL